MITETATKQIPIFEDLFSEKIYWLNQLSGELPETNLITDYVRPVVDSGKTRSVELELSNALTEAIIKLTKNSKFSLYLFLLAALNVLLQKYIGNPDVIVGSPVYHPNESTNKLVPLRFTVKNELTFKDLLLQVKDIAIAAYSHSNYSFDELVRLLQLPQTQNRCPIFDIAILLENIHSQDALVNISNDITFSFRVTGHSIRGNIIYKESLFKDGTIRRVAIHYANLLEKVVNQFNIKIADISLLTDGETHQLLKEFNDNINIFPVELTLHQLFEKQVEQTPDKIAAIFGETQLTYREVNQKANQLARFLQQLGVERGNFVAILKQRDTDFLIAILAILKVGGVYVPIDSSYPPERIRYMVSNSEVRILLTDSSFSNNLTELIKDCPHLQNIVCLDVKSQDLAIAPTQINTYYHHDFHNFQTENIENITKGIDPAYTIYTSGSTGLPKGAIIRHSGAINHIYAQFDALKFSEKFSFLQSAPASSDISVWQFLAPILIGGKTVIVDTETVWDSEKLFKVITEKRLTIVELVPAVLRELLNYIYRLPTEKRALPDLKWMMVTGESASVELVNQWLGLYPSIKVVNAYGPTEAADDITQFIVEKPLPENQRTVPIGKPLANLNLYILDSQMQLVPIGVPGEICVSGFGVGEGYWKKEEITKLNFVPNPFPNAKPLPGIDIDFIYKTGDLGRWLPDGNIEFLGRIDHQVKIRGFRIELGEIEATLSQHSGVRETVIIVREERLIAYIVAKAEPAPTLGELRSFLKDKLPEHMIPSAFIMLGAIPRTPSGKVDRRALPLPDNLRPELENVYVMPRTEGENIIANIWQKALNIEKVGVQDNFFDLGGHSLLLLQVYNKLRETFSQELSLVDLFKYPTVGALAKYLTGQENEDSVNESNEQKKKLEEGKARLKLRLNKRKQS